MYGSFETVRLLVDQKLVDPLARTATGSTGVHLAVKGNHLPLVKYLIEVLNFEVNAKDQFSLTSLHLACIK